MKTVIRKGVFETNSSSMHSITVSDKDGLMDKLPLDSDGITLTIDCGISFGWGMDLYNEPEVKAAYCILDDMDIDMLERVLKTQTGAKVINYKDEDQGDIDHQSYGITKEELKTEDDIRNFIFNPGSELVIDNDNH